MQKFVFRILKTCVLFLVIMLFSVNCVFAAGYHIGYDKCNDYGSDFKKGLDSLVKKNVITAEQESKIIVFSKKWYEERKAEREKVRKMTQDQKKAYFEKRKSEKRYGLINGMIEEKIITENQAEEIRKIVPKHKKCHK